MSTSSRLNAPGFVWRTPSTTSAKFDSASRAPLRPRMETWVSCISAVLTSETPGVSWIKSATRSMPRSATVVSVKTLTVAGAPCREMSLPNAVTTTSSMGLVFFSTAASSSSAADAENVDTVLKQINKKSGNSLFIKNPNGLLIVLYCRRHNHVVMTS